MSRLTITLLATALFVFCAGAHASQKPPPACSGHTATGSKLNVLGDKINVRSGPGTNHPKVVNQKATRILGKTHHITIDSSTVVYEECVSGEWSWVRVLEPDWLRDSHRGWVASRFLDKGQEVADDPYRRKISSSALTPYTRKSYPKTFQTYGSRMKEIETLRRHAAKMAVDSGKCDFVTMSDLSTSRSTLRHLQFWVDCRNGQRIYLDEFEIQRKGLVATEAEKAWSEPSARKACAEAIKARSLIPSEVDIHQILGTSFYKAPQTHNAVLTMDFDARNAFGEEIPYTAKCHFKPGQLGTIGIAPR